MDTRETMKKLRDKYRSWYRVAKILDISQPSVYELRDGGSIMSNKVARRAADDLAMPLEELICGAEIERATRAGDADELTAWRQRLEAARQRAAVVACVIIAAFSSHSGESTASLTQVNIAPLNTGATARNNASFLYYVNSARRAIWRIAQATIRRTARAYTTPCA